MYELFDHTADLGIRIHAKDLPSLFEEAGRALFSVLVENLELVELKEAHAIHLQGDRLEYLFFDWLNQLLYLFDAKRLLLAGFQVSVEEYSPNSSGRGHEVFATSRESQGEKTRENRGWRLEAEVRGERLDWRRHKLDHEIKAITYHGLRVEQTSEGWLAEVIVDI
ncbi:MAG: archease [Gemmatales bacterium]|nr:archease [Gemmatales bacterium]MDW7993139.1 archease [Gemmatales bacterium]